MYGFILLGGDSNLAKTFASLYPKNTISFSKSQCDVTNLESIKSTLSRSNFKYVINCAAVTDIEFCEKHPKACSMVNTLGAKKIENVCRVLNKKVIQISSDYALYPLNIYGKTKAAMESQADLKKTLVIRTSFYSKKYEPIKNILKSKPVGGFSNVLFNPVSIYRVAKEIRNNKDRCGVLNIFSSKKISKYDFLNKFCDAFGINNNLVNKIEYINSKDKPQRVLDSFVKSDINIDLEKDLLIFKKRFHSPEVS